MVLCYHEEYFALGFISALFIFVIVTLFEDFIIETLRNVRENFRIKSPHKS